ncbi:hypothetical protein BP6252_00385 [Coleophoma cylindrospora]|uniref:Alpha/beta hydrolase fold-3 domain-containing protein n=1 Tax=Coleophoma cylindrospora TaxID=1849047 RepID=A0A3D8SPV4_9HELO|nr:hypothetical protein BP6252_00385 [Coleophoma cylindrospora]
MIPRTTHTYATSQSGALKLDVFHIPRKIAFEGKRPAILYFHGGGLVALNRELVPKHIMQSCLRRNWPIVSADYDLLPQAEGTSLVDNARDSYAFVRENLGKILGEGDGIWENIIVMGSSAGGYMANLAGHNTKPLPLAILTYYGISTVSDSFYSSNTLIHTSSPIPYSRISHFLTEEMTSGSTPRSIAFNPACLLLSGNIDPHYVWPEPEDIDWNRIRPVLYNYLVQENMLPDMLKDVDHPLTSESWKKFPDTIMIHGTIDELVPYSCSKNLVDAIGSEKAQLFTIEGVGHSFDSGRLLGSPDLAGAEKAWRALDAVVKKKMKV